jgi:hypothetical protein
VKKEYEQQSFFNGTVDITGTAAAAVAAACASSKQRQNS